jgi:hypothetical protein
VSYVLIRHIHDAERLIRNPTEAALLFHEYEFIRHNWNVYSARGYSSTMPLFYFNFEEIPYRALDVDHGDVVKFMKYVIDRMELCTECIVISLIYIEKLMATSKIEIRNINWKPLIFTAILLASKFWEDINFWNVDYVEGLDLYPLKAINRMESEFISLCDYNIYVSAQKYITYQTQIQ